MARCRGVPRSVAVAAALAASVLLPSVSCRGGGAGPPPPGAPATAPSTVGAASEPPSMAELQRSVVQVLGQVEGPDGYRTAWHGSGAVVSERGMILTNAHVSSPNLPELAAMQRDPSLLQSPAPDRIVIAVAESADRPPAARYVAEVVAVDGMLDLAVLRVTGTTEGASIHAANVVLPPVQLGDSDAVALGDRIHVLGYPGLGGETVTLSEGAVAGFVPQALIGLRAWIKTDTAISSGSSGGLAVDAWGRLVGIPTQAALAPGGLNLVRPSRFAAPLLEAAERGEAYESPYRVRGTGAERLDLRAWSVGADENGCPMREVEAYPPGTTSLVAVFSYRGMADGELLFADWSYGGQPLSSDVWFWDRGPRGSCVPLSFHDFGRVLDAGRYGVEVRSGPDQRRIGSAATEVQADDLRPAEAVYVEGRVTDSETGSPLPGAVVLVFRPGVAAGAWNRGAERSLDAIYTVGESDRDGRYRLLRPLERSIRYEVAADHPEYIQLLGTFEFDASVARLHTVDIELSR